MISSHQHFTFAFAYCILKIHLFQETHECISVRVWITSSTSNLDHLNLSFPLLLLSSGSRLDDKGHQQSVWCSILPGFFPFELFGGNFYREIVRGDAGRSRKLMIALRRTWITELWIIFAVGFVCTSSEPEVLSSSCKAHTESGRGNHLVPSWGERLGVQRSWWEPEDWAGVCSCLLSQGAELHQLHSRMWVWVQQCLQDRGGGWLWHGKAAQTLSLGRHGLLWYN